MREGRTALDVPQREDVFARGLKLLVHLNEAARVGGNAGGLQIQSVGVRNAARGNKQMRAFEAAHFPAGTDFKMHARTVPCHFLGPSIEQNVNAVLFEDVRHR